MAEEIKEKKGLFKTEEAVQKFVLAAVETEKFDISAEQSLDELSELLTTAGGQEVARLIQKKSAPDVRAYFGKGKIEELRNAVTLYGADGVITDDELTPAQLHNLSDELGCKVIDRTLLILDIFSQRATTWEGQAQVELAQLNYRLTRLAGLGTELSRQGGSVGGSAHSRGAGETKLELDRRYIRERIAVLNRELKEIAGNREIIRAQRSKSQVPLVALVGYTNAGKSTLFNRLTNSSVLEEDKLFATLDTTTRKCVLPGGREVLMCDTVGFIHKLPHHLVKAFRATLEEACYADILLHVVDSSDEKAAMEMDVTRKELAELGVKDKETILVLNKQDKVQEMQVTPFIPVFGQKMLRVSAFNEGDREKILTMINGILEEKEVTYEVLIPYTEGRLVSLLSESATILETDYRDNGTYLKVRSQQQYKNKLEPYLL